ncbi:golgin subfamily A member 5-like [Macrobrachium rosenbergii]|uniref:golgin subfamily A member 5-like n=1 Tax=Macrobrachium rosenbergii TaxID=79674 RepID=UPI0034D47D9A
MLSEDEALLQLDRELDERMRNLCRKGSIKVVSKAELSGSTVSSEQNFPLKSGTLKESGHSLVKSGSEPSRVSKQISRKDRVDVNEAVSEDSEKQNLCSLEKNTPSETVVRTEFGASSVTTGHHQNEKDEPDEPPEKVNCEELDDLDEAQDAIFDDFLDQSTKIRIKTLTSKVSHLTDVLNVKQAECKKHAQAKQEALSSLQASEMSRRSMSKQLQNTQQELARLGKSNKHLSERVKELTSECQTLRKELAGSKQSHCEQKSATTSSRAQLTRLRTDNATLKEQIADLKKKHKVHSQVSQVEGSFNAPSGFLG